MNLEEAYDLVRELNQSLDQDLPPRIRAYMLRNGFSSERFIKYLNENPTTSNNEMDREWMRELNDLNIDAVEIIHALIDQVCRTGKIISERLHDV